MSTKDNTISIQAIDDIYEEVGEWHINVGEEKIYPKRMKGRLRNIKWLTGSIWLVFFLGPFLRWGDHQAVLLDLPNRKFHIFSITVLPEDLWLLAFVLLFFAILLAVVTALAGRVFCGYFCFQTVWTDIYMLIESWLEGNPRERKKLDDQPFSVSFSYLRKVKIKAIKHSLWLIIAWLTGMSFVAWFMDTHDLWSGLFNLNLPNAAWITIGSFILGTYILAGFMREQTCLWLCPYSRIQGVMVDEQTLMPAYDAQRGEPRGHRKKDTDTESLGACIDCYQCVVVCPTGIDIRHGQQQGCITCGLCIDACDAVMDKIGQPRGLVRYDSLSGLRGQEKQPWYQSIRVWVYTSILAFSVGAVAYGISTLDALELKVIHNRLPLFVQLSNGDIQNRYELKVLNKTDRPQWVNITLQSSINAKLIGAEQTVELKPSGINPISVFVKAEDTRLTQESYPVTFTVETAHGEHFSAKRDSIFIGPRDKNQSKN